MSSSLVLRATSSFLTFPLSHFRTFPLNRFRTFRLSHLRTVSLCHLPTLFLCLAATAAPDPASRPASRPAGPDTVIRIAGSKDGLSFKDTGDILLRNAAAPDLVRLPRGELLAVFDFVAPDFGDHLLAVSRSEDDGRSWSRPRPVRLEGLDRKLTRPRHGDLVWMPDGTLRLYFAASIRSDDRRREKKPEGVTLILSATTRNGERFQLDPDMRLELKGVPDAHPMVVRMDRRLHLYVGLADGAGGRRDGRIESNHQISTDGRRFDRAEPVRIRDTLLVGNAITVDKLPRVYLTGKEGLVSLTTSDGQAFKPEEGLRLKPGLDPAVARLKDDSFLMLYCARPEPRSRKSRELVEAAPEKDVATTGEQTSPEGEKKAEATAGGQTWQSFPAGSFEIDGETLTIDTSSGSAAESGLEPANSANTAFGNSGSAATDPNDPFPPKADFAAPVNYVQWIRDHYLNLATDNAWQAYEPLTVWGPDPNEATWDALEKVMLNSSEFKVPPGPWDPATHPDWAAGLTAGAGLLEYFRQASWHADYASVPFWGPGKPEGPVVEILLPSLAAHRRLLRATLSGAWQTENGQVSAERMLSALDTSLRGAGHLMKGAWIIERLVGVGERSQIQQTARHALAHNVFSTPEQIASAWNTLAQLDTDDADPSDWLRGEYAAEMDAVQRLFTPGPDGQLRIDPQGLEWFSREFGVGDISAIQQLGPDAAQKTVEAIDSFFRKAADQLRAGDYSIDRMAEQYAESNPVLKPMIPSLSRAFELRRRAQSSARATQLAYAIHYYKAQTGRW